MKQWKSFLFGVLCVVTLANAQSVTEEENIKNVIDAYGNALKSGNPAKVVKNFTQNAVLMPPNAPTFSGIEAVRGNYENLFKAVNLDLKFSIDEVVFSEDYAILRSTSKGEATILKNGTKALEVNREVFILHKEKGEENRNVYV